MAFISGAVLPIQAALNVEVGKAAKEPVFAAFASFLIGTLGLLAFLLVSGYQMPQLSQFKPLKWYVWLAGILGAFYVVAVIIGTPKLGTALTFGLVVTGQMLLSIILDHYGLFELPKDPLTWQKALGASLLILGVFLIRKF